jgi:hypothetical protein
MMIESQRSRICICLIFLGLLLESAGCSAENDGAPSEDASSIDSSVVADSPFLGVPHSESRENDNPDSPLFGVPEMTKVETTTYERYLALKSADSLSAEEQRGEFVYFATNEALHVPLGDAEAHVYVVERFRAKMPPEVLGGPTPASDRN